MTSFVEWLEKLKLLIYTRSSCFIKSKKEGRCFMTTKEKTKKKEKYLKDSIANIILTDDYTREYTEILISKAIDIPLEIVKNNLHLVTPRVNANANTQSRFVDGVFENDTSIINIEVNTSKESATSFKNIKYICNLTLNSVILEVKIFKLKPLYQININSFDIFDDNYFLYKSSILEEKLYKKRYEYLRI